MRSLSIVCFAALAGLFCASAVSAEPPADEKRLVFDTSAYRPRIALQDVPATTHGAFVSVSGVVFSHAPLERVMLGERTAALREAEPKDLARLPRIPSGASDAPYRTFFEIADAPLPRLGANDLELTAYGNDGRISDTDRLTILRLAPESGGAQ